MNTNSNKYKMYFTILLLCHLNAQVCREQWQNNLNHRFFLYYFHGILRYFFLKLGFKKNGKAIFLLVFSDKEYKEFRM